MTLTLDQTVKSSLVSPAYVCDFLPQVGRRPHAPTEAHQHSHEGEAAVQTSERTDQQLRLGEIPGAGTQHTGMGLKTTAGILMTSFSFFLGSYPKP